MTIKCINCGKDIEVVDERGVCTCGAIEFRTDDWDKVTCKHCLKHKPKEKG